MSWAGGPTDPDPATEAALARALRELAPAPFDADDELARLTPRFRRARARRRATVAGAAAVVATVLGVGGLVAAGGGERGSVTAGQPDATTTAPTTTAAPITTTATPTTPTTSTPSPSTPTAPPPVTSTAPSPVTDPPTTAAPPDTTSTSAGSPTGPPTTALPGPSEATATTRAGTVRYRWTPTSITVAGVQPAPGWTSEIHDDGPDRIEVRFSGSDDEVRVRVDLEDGVPVERID